MPKRMAALLVFLFILAGCARQSGPDPRLALQGELASPQGGFVVRQYVGKTSLGQKTGEFWIREKSGDTYRLFRYGRIATVIVAPDDGSLVVNDRRATSEAGIVLFRRNWRGRFAEVPRPDLDRAAWRQFCRDVRMKGNFPDFDHHYVWCPRWIDEKSFLVCLSGYGDGGLVERWKYAYDVRTKSLAPDPANNLKDVEVNGTP